MGLGLADRRVVCAWPIPAWDQNRTKVSVFESTKVHGAQHDSAQVGTSCMVPQHAEKVTSCAPQEPPTG